MRESDVSPNEHILSAVVSVCANLGHSYCGCAVEAFEVLHSWGGKENPTEFALGCVPSTSMICSALVSMYSKCGSIKEAKQIFDAIEKDDVVLWTAMIHGYAEHDYYPEAIDSLEKIPQPNLRPDFVAFVGVLTACSRHGGTFDLGFHYFNSSTHKRNIIAA
ncbi:hypothetical protein Ancab_037754 [Ancistrocladus abbreviatus]